MVDQEEAAACDEVRVLCGEYFDLKPNFISEFMISKDIVSLKDLLN